MRGFTLSFLLAAVVLADEPEESKAAKSEEIPIAIRLPVKRPILCTRIFTLRPDPEGGKPDPQDFKEELQFIDEHERIDDQTEMGTRFFIKTWSTVGAEVIDPCLTGVHFGFRREGDRESLDLKSRRRLPKRIVEEVLKQFSTLGIWAEFPEKARVGSSLKVNLGHLAPLLTTGKLAVESAEANVTLESLDDSGYATFRGKAKIEERGNLEGRDASMIYEGDCAIRTHPAGDRILSVTFEGSLDFDMRGEDRPRRGGGRFKVELVTEIGEAVEKARAQKPRFRERVFSLPVPPITLKLPSFYVDVEEGEQMAYLRTRESADGAATISVQSTGSEKPAKEYFNEIETEFRKEAEAGFMSSERVRSPLGEGRAFLLGSKDPDGKPLKMRNELYSIGQGRYIMYILVGSPKAFAEALPEFEKARKTLEVGP